jgi:hypothetical protein
MSGWTQWSVRHPLDDLVEQQPSTVRSNGDGGVLALPGSGSRMTVTRRP